MQRAASTNRDDAHARGVTVGVCVGLMLGLLAYTALGQSQADFDPEELGLGANTITRRPAPLDGHTTAGGLDELAALADATRAFRRGRHAVALWLGASQLHGLNNPKPDDHVAISFAQQAATDRGAALRYVQMSSPNATYYDLLATYLVLRAADARPDVLVVAVTYDDFRETATRHYENRAALEALDWPALEALGGAGIEELHKQVNALAKRDEKDEGTPQDRLENALVDLLEDLWPAYEARGPVRSRARVAWRAALASVLGGRFQRVGGKVPPSTDAWAKKALDALIAVARADGVEVALYQPPHRPDQPVFYYVRADYDARFAELQARAAKGEVHFTSFEGLVPDAYWGVTNEGRPDCFHFEVEGHRRLGRAVDAWLGSLDLGVAGRGR